MFLQLDYIWGQTLVCPHKNLCTRGNRSLFVHIFVIITSKRTFLFCKKIVQGKDILGTEECQTLRVYLQSTMEMY